ncbi:MAG: DUF1573 domain-containing protein [Cyclobacteriaceae bacterium]|nr:DUF1573 domain-containing protein [Cyclobacteriaceae bacterium]UYN87207.1 MAG: DUF1573 domain-containing protein [Cyclobacteriaceae bacterium]
MKKTMILMLATIVAVVAVAQQLAVVTSPLPATTADAAFAWNETLYDFGKIKLNEPVAHTFTFTNSGDEPLLIATVQASCGCTVTEYTKDPIPSGGKGFVKATYNAAKAGVFSKTVTVTANTSESTVLLTIKGEVME